MGGASLFLTIQRQRVCKNPVPQGPWILYTAGTPRTRHRGLLGPSGPEPQKSPKRVRKGVPPRGAPESPKSPPRSPKRVQKQSEAALLDSFRTPWGTLWGLRGSPGQDTLRTLFWLFPGSGPEGPGRPLGLVGGVPNFIHCWRWIVKKGSTS